VVSGLENPPHARLRKSTRQRAAFAVSGYLWEESKPDACLMIADRRDAERPGKTRPAI